MGVLSLNNPWDKCVFAPLLECKVLPLGDLRPTEKQSHAWTAQEAAVLRRRRGRVQWRPSVNRPWSIWDVAEELGFSFYLISLNFSSHMCLVALKVDSAVQEVVIVWPSESWFRPQVLRIGHHPFEGFSTVCGEGCGFSKTACFVDVGLLCLLSTLNRM